MNFPNLGRTLSKGLESCHSVAVLIATKNQAEMIMKLVQKKPLKPTFLFELNNKQLRVTRKTLFSSVSFDVKIKELSPNRIEESKFAVGWLIVALLLILWCIWWLSLGITMPSREERWSILFLSIFPLAFSILAFVKFNQSTYNYVSFYRNDTGRIGVTFYKNMPNPTEFNNYIESLQKQIDPPNTAGFGL